MKAPSRGFTIIELMVVCAVIMIILSILLTTTHKVKQRTQAARCLYNLRQLALATISYSADSGDCLPYPVGSRPINGQTKADEGALWFTALDRYLLTLHPDDPQRPGVAGQRSYRTWKECVVWTAFPMTPAKPPVNTNQTIREYSRSIKMNSHLRRIGGGFARTTDIDRPSQHVLYGDGTSIDQIDWPTNTSETSEFSMDVNQGGVGGIAIRHLGGANVVFVDGHASTETFTTYQRKVGTSAIRIPSWQSEFINAAGTPVNSGINGTKTMEAQGFRRNPQMPLIWSIPGRLYRP